MGASERLLYGFDPLCGWCFAFRPSMRAVREAYAALPITLMCGGLVVGERVRPLAQDRDYLIQGLAAVQRTTGVRASEAFFSGVLAEGSYVSNSEPLCRAITVVEQLAAQQAYDFADSITHAFYERGLAPDAPDLLAELAAAQGVDAATFLQHWHSDAARIATQERFREAQQQGFVSYPTLVYERDGQRLLVGRGYLTPAAAVAGVAAARGA